MGMTKSIFSSFIKKLAADNKKRKIIVALGFIFILLILMSVFFDSDNKDTQKAAVSEEVILDREEYTLSMENRLTDILKDIYGVGEVKVMLTIDDTGQNIYQSDIKKTNDSSDSGQNTSYEQQLVLIKDNSGKTNALLKSTEFPKVSGVVVVCEGGDDINVQKRVIGAVTTVFDISSAKVCVTKLENKQNGGR